MAPVSYTHLDVYKRQPLRRAGERGENKWERISWDEAMAEIKEKVNKIWQEYGSQAIIAIHGTGRNVNWQLPLIGYTGLRTPNVTKMCIRDRSWALRTATRCSSPAAGASACATRT